MTNTIDYQSYWENLTFAQLYPLHHPHHIHPLDAKFLQLRLDLWIPDKNRCTARVSKLLLQLLRGGEHRCWNDKTLRLD